MEESRTARQEFVIAFVGPATSAVLGLIFLGVFYATGRGDTPLAAVVEWLGFINIVLAIFNMLPGFPLDGGRVLRSALWGRSGNMLRATRWASTAGTVARCSRLPVSAEIEMVQKAGVVMVSS